MEEDVKQEKKKEQLRRKMRKFFQSIRETGDDRMRNKQRREKKERKEKNKMKKNMYPKSSVLESELKSGRVRRIWRYFKNIMTSKDDSYEIV